MSLLEVRNLRLHFRTDQGSLQAVEDVSLRLEAGQTSALVGESGSGKTVTGLAMMGLLPAASTVIETGEVLLEGRDLLTLPEAERRRLRGNEIAMVFQDPMTSLNPYLTVGLQVAEVLEAHRGLGRREALRQAARTLGEVGLPEPEAALRSFPHQFSGGMRQRVLIAMAIVCEPKVLIADEPTTALDVTVQAQVLDLLRRLQEDHGTSILLITHDLGVVADVADEVHVMYAGRLVESGPTVETFARPLHPYTFGLLRSVPAADAPPGRPLPTIPGLPPDPLDPPGGCAFHPRCPFSTRRCEQERPSLEQHQEADSRTQRAARMLLVGGRRAACFEREQVGALTGLWHENYEDLGVQLEGPQGGGDA